MSAVNGPDISEENFQILKIVIYDNLRAQADNPRRYILIVTEGFCYSDYMLYVPCLSI